MHFGLRRRVSRSVVKPGESGDDLPEDLTRAEAIGVIPTTHILARRRQAGALPIDLQHPVLIQARIGREDAILLRVQRAASEFHIGVSEDVKLFLAERMVFVPSTKRELT